MDATSMNSDDYLRPLRPPGTFDPYLDSEMNFLYRNMANPSFSLGAETYRVKIVDCELLKFQAQCGG